jgi:hypothetical protein
VDYYGQPKEVQRHVSGMGSISGIGGVDYYGQPKEVQRHVSGMGSISSKGEKK